MAVEKRPANGPVVFFVDDDAQLQRLMRRLLERAGYQALQAESAEEAEALAEKYQGRIDALIMDVNLPDGWGATVAQRLKVVHPEMVIIYTTGSAASDPILSGGLRDARWFLPKPFGYADLVDVLESAMSNGSENSGDS